MTTRTSAELQCERLRGAAEVAGSIRNLTLPDEIGCIVADKDEYLRLAAELFSEDLQGGELKRDEIVYKALGFIPEDYPYERCLVSSTLEDVGAFYSAERKAVVLPDWQPTLEGTLIHESVHALQDKAFDLLKLKRISNVATDRALAFAAAVEADAVITERQAKKAEPTAALKGPEEVAEPDECDLPETLLFQYEFPYTSGPRWLERGIKAEGESFRDRMFSELPRTTTEILHEFGKTNDLAVKVEPVPLEEPSALTEDFWKGINEDSLGEYTIRTILRPAVGSKDAVKAAMGWKNDVLRFYQGVDDNAEYLISWISSWRSEHDAAEFAAAYDKLLSRRAEQLQALGDLRIFRDKSRSYALHRNGKRVEVRIGRHPSAVPDAVFHGIEDEVSNKRDAAEPAGKIATAG